VDNVHAEIPAPVVTRANGEEVDQPDAQKTGERYGGVQSDSTIHRQVGAILFFVVFIILFSWTSIRLVLFRTPSPSQAKAPAPPRWINCLRHQVGRASACQDFCHRLLALDRLFGAPMISDRAFRLYGQEPLGSNNDVLS
jgi:hypothetical protein